MAGVQTPGQARSRWYRAPTRLLLIRSQPLHIALPALPYPLERRRISLSPVPRRHTSTGGEKVISVLPLPATAAQTPARYAYGEGCHGPQAGSLRKTHPLDHRRSLRPVRLARQRGSRSGCAGCTNPGSAMYAEAAHQKNQYRLPPGDDIILKIPEPETTVSFRRPLAKTFLLE